MNKNKYLDLAKYYNGRMVYSKTEANEDEDIGRESKYCFFDEDKFEYGVKECLGNAGFYFKRGKEKKDCIICRGQEIILNSYPCHGIMFAGFCIWGYFKEKFILRFCDGSEEEIFIGFSDIAYTMEQISVGNMDAETKDYLSFAKVLSKEQSLVDSVHYLYYQEMRFNQLRRLQKIVFPDNVLMYIAAITII